LPIYIFPIQDLEKRHPGLTKAIATCFLEAASVCLDRHHSPPQTFTISNESKKIDANANWVPPSSQQKAAWANEIDTTEWGAYGFAIAAVELIENMYAIHRAETKTGADYYIAPLGHSYDDLENALRLEVSGTSSDDISTLNTRLKIKVEQASKGKSNLPAIAVVVGFCLKLIKLSKV